MHLSLAQRMAVQGAAYNNCTALVNTELLLAVSSRETYQLLAVQSHFQASDISETHQRYIGEPEALSRFAQRRHLDCPSVNACR